ncbi:hypothetical protein ABW21_db0202123 [Orbilia brochopaga]|nr:hypothetical protein ABW21_db0202123 [Drechslerella brochopaga]
MLEAVRPGAMLSVEPKLCAYSRIKLTMSMALVPWPGRPGKWLMLNLKSADSKAMMDRRAAASPTELMLYMENDLLMLSTASEAVAHSSAYWAPLQVLEVGATART